MRSCHILHGDEVVQALVLIVGTVDNTENKVCSYEFTIDDYWYCEGMCADTIVLIDTVIILREDAWRRSRQFLLLLTICSVVAANG